MPPTINARKLTRCHLCVCFPSVFLRHPACIPPWGAASAPSAHPCHPDRRPHSSTDLCHPCVRPPLCMTCQPLVSCRATLLAYPLGAQHPIQRAPLPPRPPPPFVNRPVVPFRSSRRGAIKTSQRGRAGGERMSRSGWQRACDSQHMLRRRCRAQRILTSASPVASAAHRQLLHLSYLRISARQLLKTSSLVQQLNIEMLQS